MRIIDVLKNTATDLNSGANQTIVRNLIIMDESGSMHVIYREALSGLNETLSTIRNGQEENPGQQHKVTLIAFDSGRYNQIYDNTPAQEARDITEKQYHPGGATPLYDAMGRAIEDMREKASDRDVVLVTIITDGMENASRRYNAQSIKELVEQMKERGWVFTYIGANQDVEAVACAMCISNSMSWDSTQEGTKAMFEKEHRARKRFFDRIRKGVSLKACEADYFKEDDDVNPFA